VFVDDEWWCTHLRVGMRMAFRDKPPRYSSAERHGREHHGHGTDSSIRWSSETCGKSEAQKQEDAAGPNRVQEVRRAGERPGSYSPSRLPTVGPTLTHTAPFPPPTDPPTDVALSDMQWTKPGGDSPVCRTL
jgi:hypothetical protein